MKKYINFDVLMEYDRKVKELSPSDFSTNKPNNNSYDNNSYSRRSYSSRNSSSTMSQVLRNTNNMMSIISTI